MRFSQIAIVASLVTFAVAAPLRSSGANVLVVRHNSPGAQSNPSGGNGGNEQLSASEEPSEDDESGEESAAKPSPMDMTSTELKEY